MKIRLVIGPDEHIRHEMLLPCHLMDETDPSLRLGIRATESVKDVALVL